MESGEQCVIICGLEEMLRWSAESLDIPVQVLLFKMLLVTIYNALITGATAYRLARFGQGGGPIFISDVKCRGTEYRLIDCGHGGIEDNSCSHSEDAGVTCLPGKDCIVVYYRYSHGCFCIGCAEGELRLVGGANYNEGRVEICQSNEWGTVCDQMWDVTDASVVCRQQGFPSTGTHRRNFLTISSILFITGAVALTGASFGQGTGRIWLYNVQCTGSERVLMNCTASIDGSSTCTHAQDAGVRCQSGRTYWRSHKKCSESFSILYCFKDALKEIFGFWKDHQVGKVAWRYAGTTYGAVCVLLDGEQKMPELFVASSTSPYQV